MTYAEIMRKKRNTVQYCYLQYNEIRQKRPQAFIAFFEGHDAPYYLSYIASIVGSEPEQIICGNKQKVIETHKSLKAKNVLKNAKTGFFVDRDYDDNAKLIDQRQDFYVTKGYSIENYYCTKRTFERILVNLMHYNCAHKDYDALVENYVDLQKKYNNAILEFNGWYCSLKRKGINMSFSLSENMPSGYLAMDLTQYVVNKNYTMTQIHRDFKVVIQPAANDIHQWSSWIMQDAVYNMRGKYEFAFLVEYLKTLPRIVNNPDSPFENHPMSFSLGQKDALSALAQYAERDEDLRDYIKRRAA